MNLIRFSSLLGLLAAGMSFPQNPAVAAEVRFENIRSLDGLLPRKTQFYEVAPEVKLKGAYYQFKVKSGHGTYEVESIRNLLKVCHEIKVMEQYKATDAGGEVWKGFSGSLKNLGTGAKAIVTNPNRAVHSARLADRLDVCSSGRRTTMPRAVRDKIAMKPQVGVTTARPRVSSPTT